MAKGKYQKWLEPANLERLTNWAANGLTYAEMAKSMGITESTFYVWQSKFPEISEAIKIGRELSIEAIENALFKRAHGMVIHETVIEEIVVKDAKDCDEELAKKEAASPAKRKTTIKEIPPDVAALIFYLKNKAPDRYSDKRVSEVAISAPTISLGVIPERADD